MTCLQAASEAMQSVAPNCAATLYAEYGVIHLRGSLSETEQKALWAKCKGARNPAGANQTSTQFHLSSGTGSSKDEPLSEYGKLLYARSAVELAKQMTEEDCKDEPSFKRLHQIISGVKPVNLNHISGIVYSKQANLRNHQDVDKVFYTMTVYYTLYSTQHLHENLSVCKMLVGLLNLMGKLLEAVEGENRLLERSLGEENGQFGWR